MSSNCYVIWDDLTHECLIIDPGSEKSLNEINFINTNRLTPIYIFLTHEHSDHTWGVNELIKMFNTCKVVTSEACKNELQTVSQTYFRFYYNDKNYSYYVSHVDVTAEELEFHLKWRNHYIVFIPTPGHSRGSMCIAVDNIIFSGDTIMQFKPFLNKRDSDINLYDNSLQLINSKFADDTLVYPGHGDKFILRDRYKS